MMIEYEKLKASYVAVIQLGIVMGVSYSECKRGNDFLHKFCEQCVGNSNYCDNDKSTMKRELELLKEAHDKEIEEYYRNRHKG